MSREENVLSILIGKRVRRICIAKASVVLQFETDCSIDINNEASFEGAKGETHMDSDKPTEFYPIVCLIGLKLLSFDFDQKNKHIYLFFENGIKLSIWHIYDGYESYYVSTPDDFFVALEEVEE